MEIVKYTASLLCIFNVYEFCCFKFLPKNMNCFPFQRSSKFHKFKKAELVVKKAVIACSFAEFVSKIFMIFYR
jgi:hypothetical protein